MKRTQRSTSFVVILTGVSMLIFFIVGAIFHWTWAGFDKPLYDWMQLLIIPVVLALIAIWFNRIDKKNELAIASDNQQEAALQNYIDRMQELLLDRRLRESKQGAEVRNVAHVRTLTMFYQLGPRRTNYMLSFLREAELISEDQDKCIVTFSNVDLRNCDLHEVALYNLDLSRANLSGANLSRANLSGTDLSRANLSGTDLSGANLSGANFSGTDLSGANFSGTDLSRVNFSGVNLSGANLNKTNLSEANLSNANFSNANFSNASLNRATLHRARLSEANLSNASLNEVNLREANLKSANLGGAFLKKVDLSSADLCFARIKDCKFSEVNLRGASIDEDSLRKSSLTKEQKADVNIITFDSDMDRTWGTGGYQ